MKCEHSACEARAVFHITDLHRGVPRELQLCESHAREVLEGDASAYKALHEYPSTQQTPIRVGLDIPALVRFTADRLVDRPEELVPQLVLLLADEDPNVRWIACIGLARMGPRASSSHESLVEMTQDADRAVREAAAWALEMIRGRSER